MNILKSLTLTVLVQFLYISLILANNDSYLILTENNKQGLANEQGKIIIPIIYDELGWSNGGTTVINDRIGFKKGDVWGMIDTKNKEIVFAQYRHLFPYKNNLLVASLKEKYGYRTLYGLITEDGKVKQDFEYAKLKVHNEWLIALKKTGYQMKYGVINDNGKIIIPVENDFVKGLSYSLFAVTNDDHCNIYNTKGIQVSTSAYDSASYIAFQKSAIYKTGKLGIIDSIGNVIESPFFKSYQVNQQKIKLQPFTEYKLINGKNETEGTYYYDNIQSSNRTYLKATIHGEDLIISTSGEVLLKASGIDIFPFKNNHFVFKKKMKYGCLDEAFKVKIPPIYDSLIVFSNYFLAGEKIGRKMEWQILNVLGQSKYNERYQAINVINQDYLAVKNYGFWGVIKRNGEELISCKYDSILDISGDKILVKFYQQYAIINPDSKWVVLPTKSKLTLIDAKSYIENSYSGGYWKQFDGYTLARADKNLQLHPLGFLETRENGQFRIRDQNGNIIVHNWLDSISPLLEEELYIVQSNRKYAVLSTNHTVIIPFENPYQAINGYKEGYLRILMHNKYGHIDRNNKLRIANRYDSIGLLNEGMIPFSLLGNWGYIDPLERIKVQPKYDYAYPFRNSLGIICSKQKYGLVNNQGEEIQSAIYDNITTTKQGSYICVFDGKYGLINKNGKQELNTKYDLIQETGDGYIIAKRNGKWGVLTEEGIQTIPMIYESISYDPAMLLFICGREIPGKIID